MKNKNTFTIVDKDGKEKEFRILFTIEDKKKNYIVYTDDKKDEEGLISTYASIYNIESDIDDELDLLPIETEEEWTMIENYLNKLQSEEDAKDNK
ncbi:MAG: DUF1292 domain-containing protein [Bacilli bacterium]